MPVMDRDRWRVLEPLLDEALDLAPGERARWLDELRTTRPDAADQLSELLREEETLDRAFLERPANASIVGLELDGWTLERPIGHGGMGSVWLARRTDGRFDGTAAVKLLNLALVGDVGQARFRREGSALARLAHPAISRLLDAGVSPSGQPYLVLEHVNGQPIDAYVSARHLTTEGRVRLFLQVLDAVGHAHTSLIVHRDLKPSNILITPEGRVKLLDFGIAKLLDDDQRSDGAAHAIDAGAGNVSVAPATVDGAGALTPEYAAPEQVTGEPITTATDIYAAGVLLYVLLAGRHPTATGCRTSAEVLAALLEREPPPLGLGDLDSILDQALRKRPGERYPTAAAFADDLSRFLAHEPVRARRQSLGYRVRKFTRRHPGRVAAGTAVLLLSAVYMDAVMRDRARLRAALAESETNAARAEQVTNFAVGMFEARGGGAAYADSTSARELLSRAADRAHELKAQPILEAQMLDLIGRIRAAIGDYGAARDVLSEALTLRRRELGNDHPDVATSMMDLANANRWEDTEANMVPLLREALAIRRRRYGPTDVRTTDALYALASATHMAGDYRGAKPLFDEWLVTTRGQSPRLTPEHADQLRTLSFILEYSHRLPEAEKLVREEIASLTTLYGPSHSRVGAAMSHLGGILDLEGDSVRANTVHRAAVTLLRRAYPDGSQDLASALRNFGYNLTTLGQYADAERVWREAAEMYGREGKETVNYANALSQLGHAQMRHGEYVDAERTLHEVMALRVPTLTASSPIEIRTRQYLGETLLGEGRYAEAEPLLLEIVRGPASQTLMRGAVPQVAQELVRLYEAEGRPAEAAKYRAIAAPPRTAQPISK